MRVTIRQGIVAAPTVASAPNFLQNSAGNINVVISTVPVIFTFAHAGANYLAAEQASVTNAWGPFTGPTVNYLYWELDEVTGNIVRGATTLVPTTGPEAPVSPASGQMWFNTNNNTMFVWNGTTWKTTIRVMAGEATGSTVTAEEIGSQVGLTGSFNAGYLLRDGFGGPIRVRADPNTGAQFKFLTTDSELVSLGNGGSVVKLENSAVYVRAGESIPAFSAVYSYATTDGENTTLLVGLASSAVGDYEVKAPIGIVAEAMASNAVGTLITGGIVQNPNWTWAVADIGKSVYCGTAGEITLTKPDLAKVKQVGTIISPTQIALEFGWETDFDGVGPAGPAGEDGNTILSGAADPVAQGVNGDFYINTTSDTIFGPKAAGVWGVGTPLVGPQGDPGPQGNPGAAGQGVPTGGTAGQVLAKIDGTNYNTEWVAQSGGGGSAPLNEVVIGTGAGITSSATFAYDPAIGQLDLNAPTVATPGDINLFAAGSSAGGTPAGNAYLYAGSCVGGGGDDAGGLVDIAGGTGRQAGPGGAVTITGGGTNTGGAGGDVNIAGGLAGTGGDGGTVIINGGGISFNQPGIAGAVVIAGGTGSGNQTSEAVSTGGNLALSSGSASVLGHGGSVTIGSGAGIGKLATAISGNAGNVSITAGSSTNLGHGGSVTISAGAAAGTGTNGKIEFNVTADPYATDYLNDGVVQFKQTGLTDPTLKIEQGYVDPAPAELITLAVNRDFSGAGDWVLATTAPATIQLTGGQIVFDNGAGTNTGSMTLPTSALGTINDSYQLYRVSFTATRSVDAAGGGLIWVYAFGRFVSTTSSNTAPTGVPTTYTFDVVGLSGTPAIVLQFVGGWDGTIDDVSVLNIGYQAYVTAKGANIGQAGITSVEFGRHRGAIRVNGYGGWANQNTLAYLQPDADLTSLWLAGTPTGSADIFKVANNGDTASFSIGSDAEIKLTGDAGTAGQVLTSAGTGAAPTWQAASYGVGTFFMDGLQRFGGTTGFGTYHGYGTDGTTPASSNFTEQTTQVNLTYTNDGNGALLLDEGTWLVTVFAEVFGFGGGAAAAGAKLNIEVQNMGWSTDDNLIWIPTGVTSFTKTLTTTVFTGGSLPGERTLYIRGYAEWNVAGNAANTYDAQVDLKVSLTQIAAAPVYVP